MTYKIRRENLKFFEPEKSPQFLQQRDKEDKDLEINEMQLMILKKIYLQISKVDNIFIKKLFLNTNDCVLMVLILYGNSDHVRHA